MLARGHHHSSRAWGSDFSTTSRQSLAGKAWRLFNPAVAWPIVVIVAAGILLAVYGVARVHAEHRYRSLRERHCATLVQHFYARNPRIRQWPLFDSCLEWEQLTGEKVK